MPEAGETSSAVGELTDEIKKIHADFVAEIHKREVSSSENFDKSVLTFSSAGLALSVGFLKDFVPIQFAIAPWTLYWSWILFTLATCATMLSFLVSSRALAQQKTLAYAYYIERDDAAFTRANPWNRGNTALNYTSGVAFLVAMILSVVFISLNLERGSALKNLNSQPASGSAATTAPQTQSDILQRGLPVPTMQKVPVSGPVQSSPASGSAQPASSPAQPAATPRATD